MLEQKPEPAFVLYINGNERQGEERMGQEVGTILESRIPEFLVELGRAVSQSGVGFLEWFAADPEAVIRIAAPYIS